MGLPRFWLVCVVPLALADRCARVRTIDEQLVREAAASPCAVIALPGSLTLNISTSGGLVARNYTKIIGLADEVYSGRWQWRDDVRRVPRHHYLARLLESPRSRRRYSSVVKPRPVGCMARADRVRRTEIAFSCQSSTTQATCPWRAVAHHRRARDAAPRQPHPVRRRHEQRRCDLGRADGELVCEKSLDRNGAILGGSCTWARRARATARRELCAERRSCTEARWLSPNASLEVATTQLIATPRGSPAARSARTVRPGTSTAGPSTAARTAEGTPQ